MATIEIYGGRTRTGAILLEPFSDKAVKECGDFAAFLTEYPKIDYETDWGSWEDSNVGIVGDVVSSLGGGIKAGGKAAGAFGVKGIKTKILNMIFNNAGKFIQLLGGSSFEPPILTDSWTQLAAQLPDDVDKAGIKFDFKIVAYPVTKRGVHVEGLRPDSTNLNQVLNLYTSERTIRCANMWEWLNLGKIAGMPEKFSVSRISENLVGIKDNLNGETGQAGKQIIEGFTGMLPSLKNVASEVSPLYGMVSKVTSAFESEEEKAAKEAAKPMDLIKGISKIALGLSGIGQRIGYSFTVQLFDSDGNLIFNSKRSSCPLDFYISDLKLDFSPHLVKLVNSQGKRVGACPEWCKIELSLSSSTVVSPSQIVSMCDLDCRRK